MHINLQSKSFNSKLVRLKAAAPVLLGLGLVGFNSKLVRLKGTAAAFVYKDKMDRFQFQTGSIKSTDSWTIADKLGMFQFQTGSIKS